MSRPMNSQAASSCEFLFLEITGVAQSSIHNVNDVDLLHKNSWSCEAWCFVDIFPHPSQKWLEREKYRRSCPFVYSPLHFSFCIFLSPFPHLIRGRDQNRKTPLSLCNFSFLQRSPRTSSTAFLALICPCNKMENMLFSRFPLWSPALTCNFGISGVIFSPSCRESGVAYRRIYGHAPAPYGTARSIPGPCPLAGTDSHFYSDFVPVTCYPVHIQYSSM